MLYTGCSAILFSFQCAQSTLQEICGDYSGEDTPVPIPNTEVKLLSADDTWRATSWESKTLPLISLFGPMVKRLRHRPFTAVTRVRFPVGSPKEKQTPMGSVFSFNNNIGKRTRKGRSVKQNCPVDSFVATGSSRLIEAAQNGRSPKAICIIPGRITKAKRVARQPSFYYDI